MGAIETTRADIDRIRRRAGRRKRLAETADRLVASACMADLAKVVEAAKNG